MSIRPGTPAEQEAMRTVLALMQISRPPPDSGGTTYEAFTTLLAPYQSLDAAGDIAVHHDLLVEAVRVANHLVDRLAELQGRLAGDVLSELQTVVSLFPPPAAEDGG